MFVNYGTSSFSQPIVQNCGFDTSRTWGIINSPDSRSTNNNLFNNNSYNCIWNIQAPRGSYLTLQVTDFDLALPNDKLFILQPANCLPFVTTFTHPPFYSGERPPASMSLPLYQDSVAIYFYAKADTRARGFSIAWNTTYPAAVDCSQVVDHFLDYPPLISHKFVKNCGYDLTLEDTIHYPPLPTLEYYEPQNVYCVWTIYGPPGAHLALNFSSSHIGNTAHHLTILSPNNCSLVAHIAGQQAAMNSLHVNSNEVALYFVASNMLPYTEFWLNWTAVVNVQPPKVGTTVSAESSSEAGQVGQYRGSAVSPQV